MKEATYDEATDTWKLPRWANTIDDGNMPYRQLPRGLSFGIDWSRFVIGVENDSYISYPNKWAPQYKHTFVTFKLGPFWIVHERFKYLR